MKKEGSASAGISSNQELCHDTFQIEEPILKRGKKKALTLVIGAESLEWKQQPSGLCDMGRPQCHGVWWGPIASGALLELGSATPTLWVPPAATSSFPRATMGTPGTHSLGCRLSSWGWQEVVVVGAQAYMRVPKSPAARVCGQRVLYTQMRGAYTPMACETVSVCMWHTLDQLQKVI